MSEPSTERIAWVDIAKALAILLVVVYHVSIWFAAYVIPEGATGRGIGMWRELSRALIPVRIPLFFLVSGLLAQRALTRSWSSLWRTRFAAVLWPFALWTVLIAVPWSYRVNVSDPLQNASLAGSALAFAGAHFWYLPALVLFLVVAKILRRTPALTVVASVVASVVISTAFGAAIVAIGPVLGVNIDRWLTFGMWFMIGCFLQNLVRTVAGWHGILALAGLAVFVGLRWILFDVVSGSIVVYVAIVTVLSVVGVGSLLILSRVLGRNEHIARIGGYLSTRTLPIYVTHAFLLEVFAVIARYLDRRGHGIPNDSAFVNALFVPVVFLVVVFASLGLYELSRRLPVRWLYDPPAALTRRRRA